MEFTNNELRKEGAILKLNKMAENFNNDLNQRFDAAVLLLRKAIDENNLE